MSRYAYDPEFERATPADTPPGAEDRLESYVEALEQATQELTEARNAELEAEEARDAALRKAQLSPECPAVGVFNGVRITVAYQKAWVGDRAAKEERAFREARVARQAAQAHLRKVEKQGGFQQSITASVRETYRATGGRP